MKLTVDIGKQSYQVDLPGHSIAIGLDFAGPQPNTYGVAAATAQAYEQGGWVGDVRQGGSCNFDTYQLTPHCNGTHTECIGHLAAERIRIHEQLKDALLPAQLISITPHGIDQTKDAYEPVLGPEDQVIDRALLEGALKDSEVEFLEALVVRTLPNPEDKIRRDYMAVTPPFFSLEAMRYLRERGVQHLLVDMPSVDRLFDEGKLSTHHIFWELKGDGGGQLEGERMFRTITEMVFVPSELEDGAYLLNLQIAPFLSDAAPSRPILFELKAK